MSKEIFIKGIGKVVVIKKRGVKRMTLSVRPFRPVRLTVPYHVSFSEAERFIFEKHLWIVQSKAKIAQNENKQKIFDLQTQFKTKERNLRFEPSLNDHDKIKITKHEIIVQYSDINTLRNNEMQAFIRKGITEALRIEAKKILPIRTALLAKKHGLSFNSINVRNAKTRWGSCSGINNISLNIQLMRLPDHLIDYVILHELCHTVEKNHGPRFWALLHKMTEHAKSFDKELKYYSPEFF